jgi:pimeloyl-ACP methyl ester carboxylesterase
MYFEERGDGTPFILMHGALGSIDSASGWADMMDLFALRWRAIHLEYRGHGRSTNNQDKLTYEMIADDVCKFVDGLGCGPVHVAGVSDGAIVAMHMAMTRPELLKTIICVGANYYNDSSVFEANKLFSVDYLIEHGEAEKEAKRHDRNKSPGYWKQLVRHVAENLAHYPNYTLQDLGEIAVPTLLIAGENDPYGNRQQMVAMRQAIPNSEMLIVNNAGHFVLQSHPQIVGPVILDFLIRKGGDFDAQMEGGLLDVEKAPA